MAGGRQSMEPMSPMSPKTDAELIEAASAASAAPVAPGANCSADGPDGGSSPVKSPAEAAEALRLQAEADVGLNVGTFAESALLRLLEHPFPDVYREAARGLCLLVTSIKHQGGTIKWGVKPLVQLVRSNDAETKYAASMALRKLGVNLRSHEPLVNAGALECLLALASPKTPVELDPEAVRQQAEAIAADAFAEEMALAALDALVEGGEGSLALGGDDDGGSMGATLPPRQTEIVRTNAVAVLRDLTNNPKVQDALVDAGAIAVLVALANELEVPKAPPSQPQGQPEESRREGEREGEEGGEGWERFPEPRTTFLAASRKKRILGKQYGRGSILADSAITRDDLFDALDLDGNGALTRDEVLTGASRLGMTVEEAERLFDELDADGSGEIDRDEFAAEWPPQSDGLENTFEDGGQYMATMAVQGLRNLSEVPHFRRRLLEARAVTKAVLRSCSLGSVAGEDLMCQCAAFLANMAEGPDTAQRLTLVHEMLTVPALVTLARVPSRDCRLDATRALAHLGCNEENHETMYRQGALRALLDVVLAERDKVDREAVRFNGASMQESYGGMAIRFLIVQPNVRRFVVEEGLVPDFVRLSRTRHGALQDHRRTAALALLQFTKDPRHFGLLVKQGIVQPLLEGLCNEDPVVVTFSVSSLTNLAPDRELQRMLVEAGAVGLLCDAVARSRRWGPPHHMSANLRADVARVLAVLSEGEDLKELMVVRPFGSWPKERVPKGTLKLLSKDAADKGDPRKLPDGPAAVTALGNGLGVVGSGASAALATLEGGGTELKALTALEQGVGEQGFLSALQLAATAPQEQDEDEEDEAGGLARRGAAVLDADDFYSGQSLGSSEVADAEEEEPETNELTGDGSGRGQGDKADPLDLAKVTLARPFGKPRSTVTLEGLYSLAKELDLGTVVSATIALANLANPMVEDRQRHKTLLMASGISRPLLRLAKYPYLLVQRCAALAIAGLCLGDPHPCNMKHAFVEGGALPPLLEMIKLPHKVDREEAVRTGLLGVSAILLGPTAMPKNVAMHEFAIPPLLEVAKGNVVDDPESIKQAVFAIGSMSEAEDVRVKLVEVGTIPIIFAHLTGRKVADEGGGHNADSSVAQEPPDEGAEEEGSSASRADKSSVSEAGALAAKAKRELDKLVLRRGAAYFCANLSQNVEFHDDLVRCGGLEACVTLASSPGDVECQEYAAFALAFFATNRDLQRPLVELGALKPLVQLVEDAGEPRQYAALALLKLADMFENHVAIARSGGLTALLKLGRGGQVDEEFKCASIKALGLMATNVAAMMPPGTRPGERVGGELGFAAEKLLESKTQVALRNGRAKTLAYLTRALRDAREAAVPPVHMRELNDTETRPP
eukprot:CAMPEP_0172590810 /NCGR_PEP_ID=MMETSP1068-20121228/9451_1 /TAXON_ID=35684 /ORGANISM="Pseudopedinella elastica, Strain CCMP716" /LENGTH=1361 /DNA_ID=CAMNT_0013386913 /DNA_START=11 /DNA_END=4096 /DNA_ORIENTATION=-